jgi:hypothetical protein
VSCRLQVQSPSPDIEFGPEALSGLTDVSQQPEQTLRAFVFTQRDLADGCAVQRYYVACSGRCIGMRATVIRWGRMMDSGDLRGK